jgi:hypothetical protein
VRVSKDLSYATVYFSVLGAQPQQAQEILEAAAPLLRGPLGRALGIRHSPELRFVQDELIESGARLSALINKAVKDDTRAPRATTKTSLRMSGSCPTHVSKPSRFYRAIDGILLLDKALGVSSNAALQQVRALFNAPRRARRQPRSACVGLLPVCFGQATKVCGRLLNSGKTYRCSSSSAHAPSPVTGKRK